MQTKISELIEELTPNVAWTDYGVWVFGGTTKKFQFLNLPFYLKSAVDTLLSWKSDNSHTHDDRYYLKSETYTQSEVDSEISTAVVTKENNCTVQTITANYTFTWSEANNGWYSVNTSSWNITINLNPSLFPTTNWLYEFIFCKSTNDANTVTIDAGSGNAIDDSQTYVLSWYFETVTVKVVSSTFIKSVSTTRQLWIEYIRSYLPSPIASATIAMPILASSDTEILNITDTTYTKYKEIEVPIGWTYLVTWEMDEDGSNTFYAKIYVNWVAVWTEFSVSTSWYIRFWELVTVSAWDLLQLYCKIWTWTNGDLKNFRIYGYLWPWPAFTYTVNL